MNSRNMIRTGVLGLACLLGTAAVRAQATPGSASSGKIGVINVRQAIVTTAEGKQASAELQTQFTPRQNELEGMNKQINDLRNRLSAGANTLSDEEKVRLTQQGQRLTAATGSQEQRIERRRAGGTGGCGGPHWPEDDGRAGPLRAGERAGGRV